MIWRATMFKATLLACLACLPGTSASAQIFDLSTAWGAELRTVDVGVGWELFNGSHGRFAILGGAAAVESGLKPQYSWTEDKTRIEDGNQNPVDPRTARTDPSFPEWWGRVEYQKGPFGAMAMWDPRQHFAAGIFGSLPLTSSSEVMLELRTVHGIGVDLFSHDFSVRLRWR